MDENVELRFLLLSAGSLTAQNVLQALGTRRERCVVIGTNSVAEAAGNFRCDRVYLVPPAAAQADYIARLEALIREERPDLVIPCRDDDVFALARLGERSPHGSALLTGTVAAARALTDKLESARFADRHGLPFMKTAATVHEALALAAAHGLPLIGKPRRGNGTRGVVLLRSRAEIERAFAVRGDLIAQPFLEPPADVDALTAPFDAGLPLFFSFPTTLRSVQIVVGPDGNTSSPFGALNTQVGGLGTEMTRCDDPELLEVGKAYARALAAEGWRGPLNVQLKRDIEGKLMAFELNGRFGGATAGRALLGFDEVGEAVNRFLASADFPRIARSDADTVQRYNHSYAIPPDGPETLERQDGWCSTRVRSPASGAARAAESTLRFLILSSGSLAAQNVIQAICARDQRSVLIGMNSIAEAAGNFRCDRVYLAPPAASSSAYIERIAELVREERPHLVIPTRDDDIMALAMLAEQSPTDAVLLTGSVAAVRFLNDKVETARFARRHRLPFAYTVDNLRDARELAATFGLPLVGKPRSGNGSRGVVILRSIDEIERAFATRSDLVAQPLLDPPPNVDALTAPFEAGMPFFFSFPAALHSIMVIVGPDGCYSEPYGAVVEQTAGAGARYARTEDRELIETGHAYARATAAEGWRGPLNVQLMRDRDGRLTAFELNGRMGGSTGARAVLGSDDIGEIVSRFLPGAPLAPLEATGGKISHRFPRTYAIPREGLATLRSTGRWLRSGRSARADERKRTS
jgi:carbamoyl-phosphate synthase large subunit